jgi:hypothetical protein
MEYSLGLLLDLRLNSTVDCCGLHAPNVLHAQHAVKEFFTQRPIGTQPYQRENGVRKMEENGTRVQILTK